MFYCELELSEQVKHLLSLYIQDSVPKAKSRDYTRLKKMVVRYGEQNVKDQLEMQACLALLQPRAKENETVKVAYDGHQMVGALEVKSME